MRMIQKESDKSDRDKSGEWKRRGKGGWELSRQKQTKLLLKWREEGPQQPQTASMHERTLHNQGGELRQSTETDRHLKGGERVKDVRMVEIEK